MWTGDPPLAHLEHWVQPALMGPRICFGNTFSGGVDATYLGTCFDNGQHSLGGLTAREKRGAAGPPKPH